VGYKNIQFIYTLSLMYIKLVVYQFIVSCSSGINKDINIVEISILSLLFLYIFLYAQCRL